MSGDDAVDAALRLVGTRAPVGERESVPVDEALGRVLADDVVAAAPVPGHDSSAMDGYAFRYADLGHDRRLRVEGRVAAGHPLGGDLAGRAAARIFTGAPLPAGADTVAMQEHCRVEGGAVIVAGELARGANCRRAGDDVTSGALVLRAGTRLRPQHIGIATAIGCTQLTVWRRLRVGLLVSGDELRSPGEPLPPGCIYDSNRHTLAAALRGLGAIVTDYGIAPDDRGAIRDALAGAAAANDLVVSAGGMSEGEEDHVRAAVAAIGSIDLWQLPIKPGRPTALGVIGVTPFVGLPGNPVSASVTFWLIARPQVLHLMGASGGDPIRYPVTALFEQPHRPGRREYLRGRLRPGIGGSLGVEVYRSNSSALLSSLVWSDGLIELAADAGDVAVGDLVSYLPYDGLE